MELKIDEFKTVFFGELDKVMLPMGFKYVKSRHGYVLNGKNDWNFHVLIDCTKWSTSIEITTKISAVSNRLTTITKKITGRKREFCIWGTFPLINRFLEQQGDKSNFMCYTAVNTASAPREFFCSGNILQLAQKWTDDFEKAGKPFIDRITTERDFALNIVRKYHHSFYCLDRALSLPILCTLSNMDKGETASVCEELETQFEEFKTMTKQSDEQFQKWTDDYYKVKQAILRDAK